MIKKGSSDFRIIESGIDIELIFQVIKVLK
jgi:hypothetical protein